MKKWMFRILLLFLTAIIILGFNRQLTLTQYRVSDSRIPAGFDGYRIAVVSDLHAERFGQEQQDLIAMVQGTGCDLICFPGDLVSDDTTDFSPVWELIEGLSGIPMVYVAGNNELSMKNYDGFLSELVRRGVTVLDDMGQTNLPLDEGTDRILVHGYPFTDSRRLTGRIPVSEKGVYDIFLYHDPYCFPEAAMLDYDLVLSGHIHGGMIRFPFLGSPLEWLDMEPFTKGVYRDRAATLIVSGGLGPHESLPRFFNAPEVVLITLDVSGNL